MEESKRYTLAEAKRALARLECERHGHQIGNVLHQVNAREQVVLDLYGCARDCGVEVTVAYPEDAR